MAGAIAEAPIKGIGRTLTESGFVVPTHQGNYRWKEDEVKQLFDDVIEAMQRMDDAYFLGLMVFMKSEGEELVVLDGQQRLTTSIMILSAIRGWLNQYTEYKEDARHITEHFIGRKELGESVIQPRLSLNIANHEAFERFVVNEVPLQDIVTYLSSLKRYDPNRVLLEASIYCHKRITDIIGEYPNSTDAYNYLLDFVKFLRDKVFVVSLVVSSDVNAYTIFATLNDRGLELSPLDLVKNYLFSLADTSSRMRGSNLQLRTMEARWVQMIRTLGNVKPANFLKAYWTSRHGRIQNTKLFESLKARYKDTQSAVNLSMDMLSVAEQYNALEVSDDPLWAVYNPKVRESITSLRLLGAEQTRPIMLSGLAKFDPREFERLLRFLEVLIVRYQLVGGGRTGALEIHCARLARLIFNGDVTTAAQAYQEMRDIYPSDEEFRSMFLLQEEDTNSKAAYMLRRLESEARRQEKGANAKELDPSAVLTVEHILPRNPTAAWRENFSDDEQVEDAIYRLGNLCLVARNRELGRELFDVKKRIFEESDLYLTKDLVAYDTWNMETIIKRQTKLAKYAVAAWRFQ